MSNLGQALLNHVDFINCEEKNITIILYSIYKCKYTSVFPMEPTAHHAQEKLCD